MACRYELPSSMPSDLKDLLQRIFVRDADARISVTQIKRHPWFLPVPASLRVGLARILLFVSNRTGRIMSISAMLLTSEGTPGSCRPQATSLPVPLSPPPLSPKCLCDYVTYVCLPAYLVCLSASLSVCLSVCKPLCGIQPSIPHPT
jgi:serine/threonine protein kinase